MANNILSSRKADRELYFSGWDRHLLSFMHELASPLTAAQLSLEDYVLSGNSEVLKLLSSNLKLMEDYLNTLRSQIKHQHQRRKPFNVSRQLDLIVRSLSPLAKRNGIQILSSSAKDLILSGNPTSFKQIINCVIKNAIDAYNGDDQLYKIIAIDCYVKGDYLIISISDNGRGVIKADQIFKPFYSTKASASSLGLGLSLASESIAEDFNGKIKLSNRKEYRTTFKLYFLRSQKLVN